MTGPEPGPVNIAEIADLLAWARRPTEAGGHGHLADRAAYLAAKADLPARTTDQATAPQPDSTKDTR